MLNTSGKQLENEIKKCTYSNIKTISRLGICLSRWGMRLGKGPGGGGGGDSNHEQSDPGSLGREGGIAEGARLRGPGGVRAPSVLGGEGGTPARRGHSACAPVTRRAAEAEGGRGAGRGVPRGRHFR